MRVPTRAARSRVRPRNSWAASESSEQWAVERAIGPQQRGEDPGVAEIRPFPRSAEPLPVSSYRFGIDGVDGEALFQQQGDQGALASFQGHTDARQARRVGANRCEQAVKPLGAVRDAATRHHGACLSHEAIGVRGVCPIDPNQEQEFLTSRVGRRQRSSSCHGLLSGGAAQRGSLSVVSASAFRPGEMVLRRRSRREEVLIFSRPVAAVEDLSLRRL